MFLESFMITGVGVLQIFLLGALGFILVKKRFLAGDALDTLSRLTISVTLPLLIFCQLIERFNFTLYPDWWIFPIISGLITLAGFALGWLFSNFVVSGSPKRQFISLVAFQNSGYLPLALIAALLPPDRADVMLVCLFLLLAGFNLIMFSFGVQLLSQAQSSKIEARNLLSPPVIATVVTLLLIFVGVNRFVPEVLLRPLRMVGDCTLPLALFVVGGSLAQIRLEHIDAKMVALVILAKLLILPAAGLYLVIKFRLPELIGLLIVMQLAMPSATSLSVIIRHYRQHDYLVSQGIFFTHLASIITIPLFLGLYFMFAMVK